MSRLDELIEEFCPDGVEYKELCKVVEIRSGWGFPNREQGSKHGEIPFYKVGDMNHVKNQQIMTVANNYVSLDTVKRLKCNPAPKGTIIFPKIGAAIGTNKKRILGQTACYDNNVMGLIIGNDVLSRFLFFIMDSISLIDFADYSGAMPSIRKSTLEKYKIPVPPLPVQQEIVRILDNFTELTSELTSELTARRKQYEYYRDLLLTFGDDVPMVALGDILVRTKGTKITAQQMKQLHKEKGKVRIFAGGKTFADVDFSAIPEKDINFKPSIIVKSRGIIEFEYYDKPFSHKNEFWAYYSQNSSVNIKFVYYYLVNNVSYFQYIANNMQMPQISIPVTDKYQIPIPPIEEQKRIVAILDRFDALCNDLTSGLPAEIEARQKQYEYYRDELLSFKEVSS